MEIFKACSLKRCQFLFWIKKTLLICFSQLFSGRMGTQNQPKMGQTNKRKSNKGISSFFITVLSIFDNFQHSKAPPLLSYRALVRGGQGGRSPLYFFRIYYKRVLNLEIFKKTLLVAAPKFQNATEGTVYKRWHKQHTDWCNG